MTDKANCPEPRTFLPPRAVAVPDEGTFLVVDGEVHRAVPTEDWEEAGAPAWTLGAKE